MLDDGRSVEAQPEETREGDLFASPSCKLQATIKRRTVADMASSLVDIFGTGAKAIVLSQCPKRDVGRGSGVNWRELLPEVFSEIARRET